MKRLSYLVMVSFFCLFACEKTEYNDVKPMLEITVNDTEGNLVSDVSVVLFETETDWKNNSNELSKTTTSETGIVLFEELEEKIYYFSATKGELTNAESLIAISSELKINIKAKITLTIK